MSISAGLGIIGFPFGNARTFWRWVAMCDEGGVDSLWQSDRIISQDPHLETMSVMAALAGGTKRLKFGMNVASLGLRDPVLIAKQCATIDVLSSGRLLPAFGLGSTRSRDYTATGTPTKGRGQRADEGLEIISRLWREDQVSFSGEHYHLDDACIAPKPIQRPMPLWVGGSSVEAIERTARWGTGWQAGIESPEQVAPVIAAIKQRCAELGRAIDADHYGAGFAFRFGSADEPVVLQYNEMLAKLSGNRSRGLSAAGTAADIAALMQEFRAAGVHKFILRPIAEDGAEMMNQTQRFIDELLPLVKTMNAA
jgi:probable F420-dependent oxidoreductase